MISIGIIGGTGYTGKKLLQYCESHPFIKDYSVYGNSTKGKSILEIFPELNGTISDSIIADSTDISYDHDVYFIALPHGEALNYVPYLIENGKVVIDLGGDYRLNNKEEYEKWYKTVHSSPSLLNEKIYGLADYHEVDYSKSKLIANPGCYPTASLLSTLPVAKHFNGEVLNISISAYSGTSGAGKSPKQHLLMAEMDGNVAAYNINTHRHQPEIYQLLKEAGYSSGFQFVTHLLPIAVGIYATSFITLNKNVEQEEIDELYKAFYQYSPFVRLRKEPPKLNWVVNTNFCDINVSVKGNTIIVTTAIDNLIKGASGQAVQNMNKYFGWDEGLGITKYGVKDASIY